MLSYRRRNSSEISRSRAYDYAGQILDRDTALLIKPHATHTIFPASDFTLSGAKRRSYLPYSRGAVRTLSAAKRRSNAACAIIFSNRSPFNTEALRAQAVSCSSRAIFTAQELRSLYRSIGSCYWSCKNHRTGSEENALHIARGRIARRSSAPRFVISPRLHVMSGSNRMLFRGERAVSSVIIALSIFLNLILIQFEIR